MDLFNLRRDFSLNTLNESDLFPDPMSMLRLWMNNAIEAEALEPTAMTLSTVSAEGRPSSRVVLVKELSAEGLVFFTNYNSRKAQEMAGCKYVAVNFIWHELQRQVRVEGEVKKISPKESDAYYKSRPHDSQIGAWASPQSQVIPNREYLEEEVKKYSTLFGDSGIDRPFYWGGYIIEPQLFEFWQGRKNRLHDRIEYLKEGNKWVTRRLAP